MTAIIWDSEKGWHDNGQPAKLTLVGNDKIAIVPLDVPPLVTGMRVSEIAAILCIDFYQVMRVANDLDAQGYNIFYGDKTLTKPAINKLSNWHWDRTGEYVKPVK